METFKSPTFFKLVLAATLLLFGIGDRGLSQEAKPVEVRLPGLTLTLDLTLGTSKDAAESFLEPRSIAVDKEHRIFVADYANKAIKVFSTDGKLVETIGGSERKPIRLDGPWSVCFDERDVLYISDFTRAKREIIALSPERRRLRSFSARYPPHRILAFGESIFASTTAGDYNIQKYSESGSIETQLDLVSGMEEEKAATEFTMDRDGNFYLGRKFVPLVKKLAPDGKEISSFEYQPVIANRKPANEMSFKFSGMRGGATIFSATGDKNPVCYDIAVDSQGFQYLLVALDHAQSELCALWRIDPDNKLLGSARLPFWCSRIHIDRFDQFYFAGSSDAPYVYRCRAARTE